MRTNPSLVGFVATVCVLAPSCATNPAPSATEPPLARVAVEAVLDAQPEPQPRTADLNGTQPRSGQSRSGQSPLAAEPFETDVADRLDALVEAFPPQSEASVTISRLGGGERYQHQPNRPLYPASNEKIFTAMGALAALDPSFRFTTELWWHAESGTLTVRAGGDPTLRQADLTDLVAEAVPALDASVATLAVDATHFSADRTAPGWQDWQMPTYTGPLSTLILDDNEYRTDPEFLADPDLANLAIGRQALVDRGIPVGEVRHGSAPDGSVLVAERQSAPLLDLTTSMLRSSDNEIAEALLREIAAHDGNPGSTEGGSTAAVHALTEAGVRVGGSFADGSGLSRGNLVSSRQWVEMMASAVEQPWWGAFVDALPVSGQSGTLASRLGGPATNGRVSAKTGTIIGGLALSGLVRLPNGEIALFSIVVNGSDAHLARPTIDAIVTEIAAAG